MPPTRRNLFQGHLNRRPPSATASASTSTSVSSNNSHQASALGPNNHIPDNPKVTISNTTSSSASSALIPAPSDTGSDIIARDKNGNFQLDIPVLPPVLLDEEADEEAMEGIEEGRPSGGSGSSVANGGSTVDSELVGRDKDKLEANLVELMQRNRNRHLNSEPEILNLIQQSLRNRVAALDEDNWMFEIEDESPV
ncbi:hypothetical protein BGW36DRAFT_74689 [Talaromyces proteolyticus]|uniref:Uncharacterized protein n=1 Tax=Talaromyces proteolyticus TaxID=1131652 RepID=A0AAD4KGB7_9EURO|nr:uncharacterized protein BGW36DRAFT_74689 [Talaromyces proteolyticus]KAH8689681.1 hypothetical protein BGW36DRAFT_74689 [Talaromyces proteolyticus]